jgi:nucleotide-binding universal stress UspA family protein
MSEPDDSPLLIAYDGSDQAKAAIEAAARHLRTPRKALVLTVWMHLEAIPFWGAPVVELPPDLTAETIAAATKVAAEGVELATAAGFEAEAVVEPGEPVWRRIVEIAEERSAGLIVLGSHGRSGVAYALMGSIATAVSQHAKQAVLISRAG